MGSKIKNLTAVLPFLAFAIILVELPSAVPPILGSGAALAISSINEQHIHSIVLLNQDLVSINSKLHNDGDTYRLESSAAENHGIGKGQVHTHAVILKKSQIMELIKSGSLKMESESNLEHTHQFQFIRAQDCPPVTVPVHSPRPSPSH